MKFERFGTSATCKDGKVPIEQQLSKIISKLELLAVQFQIERAESERWRKEYDEKKRIEEEFANRKKMELNSFREILLDSCRWKEVSLLRKYIEHIEEKAVKENNLTEEVIGRLNWAKKKADWYDPLLESPDEWLDGLNQNSLLMQPGAQNTTATDNRYSSGNQYQSPKERTWPLAPWYVKK